MALRVWGMTSEPCASAPIVSASKAVTRIVQSSRPSSGHDDERTAADNTVFSRKIMLTPQTILTSNTCDHLTNLITSCGCPIRDFLFVPARYGAQFRGRWPMDGR
eukprot:2041301-Prymnesium_polylepis.2